MFDRIVNMAVVNLRRNNRLFPPVRNDVLTTKHLVLNARAGKMLVRVKESTVEESNYD